MNQNGTKLDETASEFFHHVVAQLLFLCKRGRPDLQTAVAFLTTRVKEPDTDDYKKLMRVMKYLRGTKQLYLTLESKNVCDVKWWVDASFATHPDMRSHTGGVMSLGKGAVYGQSTRQKLNTKSSTESEIVGVSDVLPVILWTQYFLQEQGFAVNASEIAQDNDSAILLENYGKALGGRKTRHINIRYFFVTDRVQAKEIRITRCNTDEMIADYFTKPLQGSKFQKFRDLILNVDTSVQGTLVSKECVENNGKTRNTSGSQQEDGARETNCHGTTRSQGGLLSARNDGG